MNMHYDYELDYAKGMKKISEVTMTIIDDWQKTEIKLVH